MTSTTDRARLEAARALGAIGDGGRPDWRRVLARRSFLELDALARAESLLDEGRARVLCGPFDRLESPWLEPQGVTPQSDDGVVVARGTLDGAAVVVVSVEQRFQGGGVGEVSGAKITQALRLAAAESPPVPAVLLLETGGVRLQEANLGLNAVAEICSALLELRLLAPVVGVVAGSVGSFGGMSIAVGLCTRVLVTPQARIGLNGAAVIEQEAGVEEFDSSDRALIWAIDGGEQRRATGLADVLVVDDVDAMRAAVRAAIAAGAGDPGSHRSERLDVLDARLASLDPANPPEPAALGELWGDAYEMPPGAAAPRREPGASTAGPNGRGRRWITALAGGVEPTPVIGSLLRADRDGVTYLAVVPDPDNPFPRARQGQVGLTECAALARTMREIADEDAGGERRPVVAVVDLPSQAYGRLEEMAGLHQAIAAAVDATDAARVAGHPLVAVVVGQALSGGFLTHGLQSSRILALDDPRVEIHAMHKEAAARITRRTVDELEKLAATVTPLSYAVRDWATLGFCDGLIEVDDADAPTDRDVRAVGDAVAAAVAQARSGPTDLSHRLDSDEATRTRTASRAVRDTLARQWDGL